MERGMVRCDRCGGCGEVRAYGVEAACDVDPCPVCRGSGTVRGEQLTPAMVREGLAAVVEAAASGEDDRAHASEDKLRARVLSAIAGGRCEEPEACARLAMCTDVIEFARRWA